MEYTIEFFGHRNIRALHRTTLEITKEEYLTERGDCIIGVRASASVRDLPESLKEHLKQGGLVRILISVREFSFELRAVGDRALPLSHERDIVVRKSSFISDRTLAIRSTAAAVDLPREIVELLKGEERGTFTIIY